MFKAFKFLFKLGAAVLLLCGAVFVVVNYWDKIMSGVVRGARTIENALSRFSDETLGDSKNDFEL